MMKNRGSWFVVRWSWLALLACALALPAAGAPRAESAEECYFFADVAIVARALYLAEVPEVTADHVIGQIYVRALTVTATNGHERFVVAIGSIAKAARREVGYGALGFAQRVYQTCVSRGGDVSDIFGSSI